MSDNPEFVDGLFVKAPHDNAPDFVKCTISIKRKDLGNWLRKKTDEWINLDVKVSKDGKWYAQINTWKKPEATSTEAPAQERKSFEDDDIPF